MADTGKILGWARSFLLQRAVVYFAIVASSFFVIIPMGILQMKFSQECLLYSEVVYEYFHGTGGRPSSVLFRIRFGPQSVCQYNIAVSAMFSLVFALAMGVVYVFFFVRERTKEEACTELVGQGVMVGQGVAEVVVVLLMLVSAGTVSHGFASLCSDVTDTGIAIFQVHRCAEAQGYNWRGFDSSNFFVCLAVVTAGCWMQAALWTLQTWLVLRHLWRLHVLPSLPDWVKESDTE